MMQKKPVHPVQYKSVTSRARTMETRSIAPQSAPVKWKRITPQGGFTLIEILIAMTIFSTSFLALAAGATTVMKSNHSSYNSTIATNMAQDKLEELMATGLPFVCTDFTIAGCFETLSSPSNQVAFNRSWQITSFLTDGVTVNKIEIKVDWTDQTAHSVTITSAASL